MIAIFIAASFESPAAKAANLSQLFCALVTWGSWHHQSFHNFSSTAPWPLLMVTTSLLHHSRLPSSAYNITSRWTTRGEEEGQIAVAGLLPTISGAVQPCIPLHDRGIIWIQPACTCIEPVNSAHCPSMLALIKHGIHSSSMQCHDVMTSDSSNGYRLITHEFVV